MPSGPESRDDDVELPPLDADGDEAPADSDEDFEIDEPVGDDDPFDDRESDDLDAGVDLDDLDEDDDDGLEGVDVGADDEGIDLSEDVGDDDEGLDDEEDDDDELVDAPDDGGAEGTADAPEDEVSEAALPELDADEEGADDGELAEVLFAEATAGLDEVEPWEPIAGAGAEVPCSVVAARSGHVVAGGDALLIGEGAGPARATNAASGVIAVALAEEIFAFANRRGQVLWSHGPDAPAVPLGGWTPAHGDLHLAATPGRLFILADNGVWSFTATGERLAIVEPSGVLAIAASGSVVATLIRGSVDDKTDPHSRSVDGAPSVVLRRGDDEALPTFPLVGDAVAIALGVRHFAISGGGKALALADQGSIVVSRDGGRTYALFSPGDVEALMFAGDGADAPLFALMAPEDGVARVVRLDIPRTITTVGEVRVVTATGDPDKDDREDARASLGMAWDPAGDLLWIAAPAGLSAYRRAAKH